MKDITIVPDQEINLLACLTEIMMSCEFKWNQIKPHRRM
jgi:replication factor C small subunit